LAINHGSKPGGGKPFGNKSGGEPSTSLRPGRPLWRPTARPKLFGNKPGGDRPFGDWPRGPKPSEENLAAIGHLATGLW
jgi:hypothetical protein